MDKFDEKVIGYDSIKETLRQIADVLKRPEAYKEKGVSMPRGLLMESAPGLGKSLMASILMEESGRKSFVFRRINEGNTFLGEMKDIFDVAKEEAPSILLLEDLNLYVESNSPYAPEWACLQACIDETSDADIFVIATTNDTRYMPQSLLRPGRFDYILNLNPPLGKTAEDIVSYYLRDKNLAKDVQISDIVEAIQQFASQLQDEMQSKCSDLLKERSEHLSVKVKEYVSDYQEGVQASFQEANLNADFDAGYAFASSLAKIGIIGGLGAFLAADAAFAFGSWAFLFGIGGQIALFANFLGPIGIVAGALISAGLGIMKLFGGGWEKSVAKKLVNAYEEKGVTDQYRKAINEYWAQTETAFDQAAEQLDQAWTAYVERLQTTVDSYDIEQIETSLTAAKGIQNFFEHIPL